MSSIFSRLLVATVGALVIGCGGNSDAQPVDAGPAPSDDAGANDAAPADANTDATPRDHGTPSTTYPAFKPDMPQLHSNGGPTIASPVLVAITWETDPLVAQIETFGDGLGASAYWTSNLADYGVGPVTSGAANHVHVPVTDTSPVPTSFDANALDDFIHAHATSATSGWPMHDDRNIYVVYLHPSTKLSENGTPACTVLFGYHTATSSEGIPYIVIPRCSQTGRSAIDSVTGVASGLVAAAAVNPVLVSGYYGLDQDHTAFDLWDGIPFGDIDNLCLENDSWYTASTTFPFVVQSLWSNAAGAAGHSPCSQPTSPPYFNAVPLALETVSANLSPLGKSQVAKTKGFQIKVGETKTFAVGIYSDGPTDKPLSVGVLEAFHPDRFAAPTAPHLTTSIDVDTAVNGQIAYITVTVNTAGQTLQTLSGPKVFAKLNIVTVIISDGTTTHYAPVLIVN